MTRLASTPAQISSDVAGVQPGGVTHVDLTWIEGRIERWLRFGRPVAEHRIDRRRRTLSFAPGVTFALVRWTSGDFGTLLSRLDIVRVVASGAALQTLPRVRPGGEVLLSAVGWRCVERVLGHIDAIEGAGIDPADVDPDHWRHVHNRIAAGQPPSPYTRDRHRASILRRSVEA